MALYFDRGVTRKREVSFQMTPGAVNPSTAENRGLCVTTDVRGACSPGDRWLREFVYPFCQGWEPSVWKSNRVLVAKEDPPLCSADCGPSCFSVTTVPASLSPGLQRTQGNGYAANTWLARGATPGGNGLVSTASETHAPGKPPFQAQQRRVCCDDSFRFPSNKRYRERFTLSPLGRRGD